MGVSVMLGVGVSVGSGVGLQQIARGGPIGFARLASQAANSGGSTR